ncbi:DNA sulfur modification protein DndB [Vibrio owensii]|uniref:DNA sulfur modification protein DndB n=1 Tax=Vibrio owensii TaxID=696485 RepID=UPI003747D158
MFGNSWPKVFGTYGEFSLDDSGKSIPMRYLLTKMKPGKDGTWECDFASQLAPWREIFNVEELTFDELVQRDLDDSRVAHDLIPYILSENEESARFFPPILAVLTPTSDNSKGIADYYPSIEGEKNNISSQGVFKFNSISIDGNESPFGCIEYNRQKTKFVIVDGQHRAMAILALHRQLNKEWGDNSFQSYYDHLNVNEDDLKNIELPVCVLFAPELNESNDFLKDKQINLNSVCREIFLAVNKNAKKVSKTREILLDDEDLAARMMRKTLTSLKDRKEDANTNARIYSFAYGDDDEANKQVLSGKFEYSTAVFLHKLHLASSFATSDSFRFDKKVDITDGRRLKNSERASELLVGTELQEHDRIPRQSGKQFSYPEVQEIVSKLGCLTDNILLPLYDSYNPFKIQNQELRKLRTKLSDSNSKSDLVQSKCYSLLFEGSGAKTVFEAHRERLKKIEEAEGILPDSLTNQKEFIDSIEGALMAHENNYKISRALSLFNYDERRVKSNDDFDQKLILNKAKSIFDTVNTQAFQLGYLMAVQSVLEMMDIEDEGYAKRLNYTSQLVNLFLSVLNFYFSDCNESKRIKFGIGYFDEPRANVFSNQHNGLRRLLYLSGTLELNEKQWHFFRYAILEILFSKYCTETLSTYMENELSSDFRSMLEPVLEDVKKHVLTYREELFVKINDKYFNSVEYRERLEEKLTDIFDESERASIEKELVTLCKKELEQATSKCIDASLCNKISNSES